MTCAAIMNPHPPALRDNETVASAAALLISHEAADLPVVDADGRLAGTFGIDDLLGLLVPQVANIGDLVPHLRFVSDEPGDLVRQYRRIRNTPLAKVMNRDPACVHPDTPVIEAIRLLHRRHATLAVIERGTRVLAGLISHWDAARAIMDA